MTNKIPKKSSAIILLRNKKPFQVLLVQRNNKLSYGSSYAFPGGQVDHEDHCGLDIYDCKQPYNWYNAAKRAALRELLEETSLDFRNSHIQPYCRIVTPGMLGIKRHDTQFFILDVDDQDILDEIKLDFNENQRYRWDTPYNFLKDYFNQKIMLTPPVYYQLLYLNNAQNIEKVKQQVNHKQSTFPVIFQYEYGKEKNNNQMSLLFYGDTRYNINNVIIDESKSHLSEELKKRICDQQQYRNKKYAVTEEQIDGTVTIKSQIDSELRYNQFGQFGYQILVKKGEIMGKL